MKLYNDNDVRIAHESSETYFQRGPVNDNTK